jgi:cyclopropane-fatty-acyl-phospholipid synthase
LCVYLVLMMSTISTSFANALTCDNLFRPTSIAPSNAERVVRQMLTQAEIRIGNTPKDDIEILNPRFYEQILKDPTFQIGETYMDGFWRSPDISRLVAKLYTAQQTAGFKIYAPMWRTPVRAGQAMIRHAYRYYRDLLFNRQTRTRSNTVAEEHYDAGNELYRRMLDPTMTYTSGVWAKGFTLEDAQNAKYDLIARKLGLKPGDRVLDIGCGFGGFARFAAKYYGAHVTGITISIEQLKAARALSADQTGVEFVFSDYRDIPSRFGANAFDHAVSIEMIEAVGPKNLEVYFKSIYASLKDGGRFVVQAISNNAKVVNNNPWADKYIFQNGVAPPTSQYDDAARSTFGIAVDRHDITPSYDLTLMAWYRNFSAAWPDLKSSYSERFRRMWDFYILAAAGGFRSADQHVDQAVFLKGQHHNELRPVRELPSRERLDSMRASEEDIIQTGLKIGILEAKKTELEQARSPRVRSAQVPLARDARILVAGAGPSGIAAALELQRLGYTQVEVYEQAQTAGGKSHTVSIGGRPHDLGATMGVNGKYDEVVRLAKQSGQKTVSFPEEIFYDLASARPVKSTFSGTIKTALQGILYLIHIVKTGGFNGRKLEVPPLELADPWRVVMSRHGLSHFGEEMRPNLIGYGYGGPETPALFGERMIDSSAIIGSALSPTKLMWENGTQEIFKGIAKDLNLKLNTEIDRVERRDGSVFVYANGSKTPERFDSVILALPPEAVLKVLDTNSEERAVFSQVQYTPYATFAVRVEGFSDGKSQVGYIKENMTLERQGRPMAWIKRYHDDDIFIFHLFAPKHLTDEQVMSFITSDMTKLGASKLTLIDSRRWPFFPHVDAQAMREEHFFERARNLQGVGGVVFVNEALGMSTMPDAIKQGQTAAQRLASGEYGKD